MEKSSKRNYRPWEIEPKWQKIWREKKIFQPDLKKAQKPFYNLMMFPYPSGEGLHVGNMYAFTGADIYGRFKRMQGFSVFEPIGLDGFGIHSENYAIKLGRHPRDVAKETEKNFYRQLEATGNAYAWENILETYDPDYYKWTQWIFIKLYKAGLVERKKALVNWCPSCKTTLSDEQVIAGKCERCDSEVEKRELEQWFFKITQYANKLLRNLDWIDWSERTKIAQRNWIGRSEGMIIKFKIKGKDRVIDVFTTRPDTLFGATFIVVSPEHPLVNDLLGIGQPVMNYLAKALVKTEQERIAEGRKKTGVQTNFYAINPVNREEIPIWIADYIVMGYGTGAIMGVPAHDKRDFDFANENNNLPIKQVIKTDKLPYEGYGEIINSGEWNRWETPKDFKKLIDWIEDRKIGQATVSYRLRDWCISRQRYWGPPIPMIQCKKCGWIPVPEEDLPVKLPYIEDYRPKGTGKSPLAQAKDWVKTKCPKCGRPAKREADVSDTFLDSAWYFFRYTSTDKPNVAFDKNRVKKWLPVNMYIGGQEHACLHLMYTRFLTMVFKDLGLIDFEEPFKKFYAHGLLISEGAKMSKSKGNVVIPDEYIKKFGVDTLRCYLMFLGPFDQGGDFRDQGIAGMYRFLARVWRIAQGFKKEGSPQETRIIHQAIKKVTEDIQNLHYNTAIAAIMEFVNFLVKEKAVSRKAIETLALLLAPFAPHIAEELYSQLDARRYTLDPKFSVHQQPWPKYNPKLIEEEIVTIVIQVNGKVRGQIDLTPKTSNLKPQVENLAKKEKNVAKYLAGKKIKKTIFVPGRLINFVV